MTIRDLNRAADWDLPDAEANTIAGLVIHEAQAIPSEGQTFNFHGFRFEVIGRKENLEPIKQLIAKLDQPVDPGEERGGVWRATLALASQWGWARRAA